ncbi:hypothetical protein J19TS1_02170 [Heyndrickxia oleronia]|nr:hypothetical protein J19TS1_02170 [Heyndrickxia oleronia]
MKNQIRLMIKDATHKLMTIKIEAGNFPVNTLTTPTVTAVEKNINIPKPHRMPIRSFIPLTPIINRKSGTK